MVNIDLLHGNQKLYGQEKMQQNYMAQLEIAYIGERFWDFQ